jgi:hypothetical protein
VCIKGKDNGQVGGGNAQLKGMKKEDEKKIKYQIKSIKSNQIYLFRHPVYDNNLGVLKVQDSNIHKIVLPSACFTT